MTRNRGMQWAEIVDEQDELIEHLIGALLEAEKHFGLFADITINGQHDPDDVRVVALIRNAIARVKQEGVVA